MMSGPVKRSASRGEKGFVLIELLITIMILGLISSFIIPTFLQSLEKTRATTCILYRQNMQVAADYYIKTNNLQPGDLMPTLAHLVSENLLPNVDS